MNSTVGKACAVALALALCSSQAGAQERPAVFDWTGFYAGFNYGTGLSSINIVRAGPGLGPGGVADRTGTGLTAGVQAGFNWQYHPNFVAGIEADINWLDVERIAKDYNSVPTFGVMTDWFGTVRGRWGYASGPSLIYIHGGAAWVGVKNKMDEFLGPVTVSEKTLSGGTAGWGIEAMLGGGWSTKAEYLYVDAGTNDVASSSGTVPRFDNRFHVFRNGLNYRFGGSGGVLPSRNWSGAYAGVFAGVSATEISTLAPPNLGGNDLADSGFTGGIQAGFNWHITPVYVAGIEADVGHLGINRKHFNWEDGPFILGAKGDWYGTLRGRIGRSTGPAFIYFTGGGALVNLRTTYGENSKDGVEYGWTYGGGIEVALGNDWTAKSEYLVIDAGSRSMESLSSPPDNKIENKFHVFRFGLNRKFGG